MIIVFSGCGNTAAATSELARLSCDDVLRLDAAMLRADTPEPQIQASGRHIIWAFPTYSWGVPPVVRRFMARVRLGGADGMTHHMFTTCGDDIGDCAAMWRSDIAARGWRSGRAFSVQMPNTYVTMRGFDVDSTETAQCKVSAMPAHVAEIAAELDRPGADMTIRGRFAWLKTRVVYPWFVRHDMSPRPFHATGSCTGCGTCVRRCPMANITINPSDKRPRWGAECAFCLGCYHACQAHAVAYGKQNKTQRAMAWNIKMPHFTLFV